MAGRDWMDAAKRRNDEEIINYLGENSSESIVFNVSMQCNLHYAPIDGVIYIYSVQALGRDQEKKISLLNISVQESVC